MMAPDPPACQLEEHSRGIIAIDSQRYFLVCTRCSDDDQARSSNYTFVCLLDARRFAHFTDDASILRDPQRLLSECAVDPVYPDGFCELWVVVDGRVCVCVWVGGSCCDP